jgi:hypothetical protein
MLAIVSHIPSTGNTTLRKTTDAGRAIMMADLETMHVTLIDAYKALSLLSGINLDKVVAQMDAKRARRAKKGQR